MTLNDLIKELQEIVNKDPQRGDLDVFVYPTEDIEMESPNEILLLDDSISDRIDINI